MLKNHQYLALSATPKKGAISYAAQILTRNIFQLATKDKRFEGRSINSWKSERQKFPINWKEGDRAKTSMPINYLVLSNHLRNTLSFDHRIFNLPNLFEDWLDLSVNLIVDRHVPTEPGFSLIDGNIETYYGTDFPLKPVIDREGVSHTAMSSHLLKRIMNTRRQIIASSNRLYDIDWLFDVRSLICDTISLVDITLNQLYLKAEYSPKSWWKPFSKEKLGERFGRRLNDKFKWVHAITGKHLNATDFMKSCDNLREIRNHLMHFDPPSVVITAEEVAVWLNQIIDVGFILVKIREAAGLIVEETLINFILLREVKFCPEQHSTIRKPLDDSKNYRSSTWPSVDKQL